MTDLDTLLTGTHELCGSADGRLLHRPPGSEWFYDTGFLDASPEASALIRRLDELLGER